MEETKGGGGGTKPDNLNGGDEQGAKSRSNVKNEKKGKETQQPVRPGGDCARNALCASKMGREARAVCRGSGVRVARPFSFAEAHVGRAGGGGSARVHVPHVRCDQSSPSSSSSSSHASSSICSAARWSSVRPVMSSSIEGVLTACMTNSTPPRL